MKNLIEKLKDVQTLKQSIGRAELEKLATELVDDFNCKKEFESKFLYFFSLNSKDIEILLKLMRKKSLGEFEEDKLGTKFMKRNEKAISAMVRKLNKYSLKNTGKPFHLSAALGELKISEKLSKSFKIDIHELGSDEQLKARALECPNGSFPRYVGTNWPWKLKLSFKTRIYRRKEDVGCHFRHGPFKGTIRNWITFNWRVALMVALQGWGFKLACDNKHFFYKWWFVFMAGLTPYSCHYFLYSRKY